MSQESSYEVHEGPDGSIQWAVISTARGDRKVHLGDCVMVKVEGQKHTGVALVHEIFEEDDQVGLGAYWLYRQQDLEARPKGIKLKWEVPQDTLPCPAKLVQSSGSPLPTDLASREVFLSAHRDVVYPPQVMHPVVVHWLGSQDISRVVDIPQGPNQPHPVIRPGFVCRKMLEMDSERLWKIHDLGSMLGLLENQALASQVRELIRKGRQAA